MSGSRLGVDGKIRLRNDSGRRIARMGGRNGTVVLRSRDLRKLTNEAGLGLGEVEWRGGEVVNLALES
jgi:hypothetical protein